MAVLSDQDRFDAWADWMRENREQIPISKVDLRAVFDAVDDELNNQAATFNNAIPQPARSLLSTTIKASILSAAIAKRYLKGA